MKEDVPTVLSPGVYSLRMSVTPGGGRQGATSDFVGWSLSFLVIGDSDREAIARRSRCCSGLVPRPSGP